MNCRQFLIDQIDLIQPDRLRSLERFHQVGISYILGDCSKLIIHCPKRKTDQRKLVADTLRDTKTERQIAISQPPKGAMVLQCEGPRDIGSNTYSWTYVTIYQLCGHAIVCFGVTVDGPAVFRFERLLDLQTRSDRTWKPAFFRLAMYLDRHV